MAPYLPSGLELPTQVTDRKFSRPFLLRGEYVDACTARGQCRTGISNCLFWRGSLDPNEAVGECVGRKISSTLASMAAGCFGLQAIVWIVFRLPMLAGLSWPGPNQAAPRRGITLPELVARSVD
jgi:hypothetical protein